MEDLSIPEIEQLQHERDVAIEKAGKMAKELADCKAKIDELEGRGPAKPSFLTELSRRVSESDVLRLSRHKKEPSTTHINTENPHLPPPVPVSPVNAEGSDEEIETEVQKLKKALAKAIKERDAFKDALTKIRDDLAAELLYREMQ